jgi:tetratricopeptide (TPR) repeat protein
VAGGEALVATRDARGVALSVDAELHRRAKEILLEALELDSGQREPFVAAACGRDAALRHEVESLLAVDDPLDDFLERPAVDFAAARRPDSTSTLGASPDAGADNSGTAPGARFTAGTVVAGRFVVRGVLGEGGMGVVYEAHDSDLGEAVALKVIRPERQTDAEWRDRFSREIRLARRVTHPNVCRVYDVFRHAAPTAADRDVDDPEREDTVAVLAMELLRGESLAERLERAGPIPAEEARRLAIELAAGLEAAHRAGIVHRDFKSANVMLVRGENGPRPVITDFGVARVTSLDERGESTLTASGQVLGTPLYMAPEQLLGAEVTPATDVYALGVVLYEMLTGARPFAASTPLSAAARRLTEEAAPLPRDRPGLDRRWRDTVARCLERDPRDRFASAAEVAASLTGERVTAPSGKRARARRRRLAGAAVAVALIPAAIYVLPDLVARLAPATGRLPSTAARPVVAVLGIAGDDTAVRVASGIRASERWRRESAAERLAAELEAGDSILALPRDRSIEVLRETATSIADLRPANIPRLGRALGASYVVVGELSALERAGGSGYRLDVRLHDAERGALVSEVTELGPELELDGMVERASLRLREALGAAAPTAEDRRAALAKLPQSAAAERAYTLGLERLRAWDAAAARAHLEQAIAAEPGYALAHLRLAEAWQMLGFEGEARDATRRAFELRDPLPRADQLFVEARYRASSYDWNAAAEIYRALVTVYPDRLDFGLRLAEMQVAAGDGAMALASVEDLRRRHPGAEADPRLDLAESDAAWAASDWSRYLEAAQRATARARALELDGVLAKSRCYEGWGLRYRGELDAALAAGEDCRKTWAVLGNHGGEADALNFLATVYLDRGDIDRASERYREAARSYERMGDLGGVAVAYSNLGNALYDRGDLSGARALYADALDLYRRVGRREGESTTETSLGNIALAAGDIAAARTHYEKGLDAARAISSKRLEALALNNYGNAQAQAGELDAAARSFGDSVAICEELGHDRLLAFNLAGLGDLHFARGDLERARDSHRRAYDLRVENGEALLAEQSRIAIGRIDLEQSDANSALGAAEAALDVVGARGSPADQLAALALQTRSLQALGRVELARDAARRARSLADAIDTPAARLEAATAAAAVAAAKREIDSARTTLLAVRDDAREHGQRGIELEAEWRALELEGRAGQPIGEGCAALQRRAAALGYAFIAEHCGRPPTGGGS